MNAKSRGDFGLDNRQDASTMLGICETQVFPSPYFGPIPLLRSCDVPLRWRMVTNMKNLKTFGVAAIICVVGLGVVLGSYRGTFKTSTGLSPTTAQHKDTMLSNPQGVPAKTPLAEMAEHTKFRFLFRHLANIQDKPGILREYQGKTGLKDDRFNELVQMAVEHEREVSFIDKQAKVMIDIFHAQYPPGKMPPGMAPPPPPKELLDLQDQRDAVSLRYRDRLKSRMGDEAYTQFKQFIDAEFTPKPTGAQTARPATPVLRNKENK